jgi:effector-binding domain-containing protein
VGNLVVKTLPGIDQAACVYHFGPLDTVDYAHQVLLTYIKTNRLQINGAVRDVYLKYDPKGNPKDYITEIQYPVI